MLFWASNDERGRPWCRDCENAKEPVTRNILDRESTLVYVGDRATWNDPKHPFRQAPFSVERVPTVIRVDPVSTTNEARTSSTGVDAQSRVMNAPRLVEGEILDEAKLKQFVSKH